MLYGSETWFLKENKVAILRRAEKSMVRAMCGVSWWTRKYRGADGHVEFERSCR